MDLSTDIAGIPLNNPLLNAAGCHCVTKEELDSLRDSGSAATVTKSSTIYPRKGNPEPRYYEDEYGSLNSMGVPNLGYQFYLDYEKEHKTKPYIHSVFPFSPNELKMILIDVVNRLGERQEPYIMEINLSCPNIVEKEKPNKKIYFEYTDYLLILQGFEHPLLIFGLKLAPIYNLQILGEVAEMIKKVKNVVKFITCCNSVVNGLIVDTENETTVIRPREGLGGLGGVYVKPTCLMNVYKFAQELEGSGIQIIGCGGIVSGKDVFDYILVGATCVQIGTQIYKEGLGCFDRINGELAQIMDKKGYTNLSDFRGKIKVV